MAPAEPEAQLTAHRLAMPSTPLSDGVVLLRMFDRADVDQIFAACQDDGIQQYIPVPRPYQPSDAEAYVARTARQWADGEKAAFAIADANQPTVVLGAINLAVAGTTGNAAYWVVPDLRGMGLAGRALRLLMSWAFDALQLGAVVLEIHPTNEASKRVARAAGFHQAGHMEVNTDQGKKDHLLFARLAGDAVPGDGDDDGAETAAHEPIRPEEADRAGDRSTL